VLEKQFVDYYEEAVRLPGVTGINLVTLLELRLDNVVHKMGFADSPKAARQLVRHGHIMLNGRKTDIPSAKTKAGDVIGWMATSKKNEQFKYAKENMNSKTAPSWLGVDAEQMTGRIISPPPVADTPSKFDPAVIVEYYSR
jgi:small subunit ribosomal protein S4